MVDEKDLGKIDAWDEDPLSDIENGLELVELTASSLETRKDLNKQIKDVSFAVLKQTKGNKTKTRKAWSTISKIWSNLKCAWIGDDPLEIDTTERQKDYISVLFLKLKNLVEDLATFGLAEDVLEPYIEALKAYGIEITLDTSNFEKVDTLSSDQLKEELSSIKYLKRSIEDIDSKIADVHSVKAEDLNFAPKSSYKKIVNLYCKAKAGKDIEDQVQDILTNHEMEDTALNIVTDQAKENARS